MPRVISLAECFSKFSDTFSPKIVAELNGQHVKVVKVEGDKVPWHTHDTQDEMFFVIEGVLDIITRESTVQVRANEFCIVPKNVEHRVAPQGTVKLMLFEPAGIAHTGTVRAEITKDDDEWLEF